MFGFLKRVFVRRQRQSSLDQLPPDVAVAAFALQMLQNERQARGLDPLERPRIVVCIGDHFDSLTVSFAYPTLEQGEQKMFQCMSEIGAFQLTPKIQQVIEDARQRARLERLRARN